MAVCEGWAESWPHLSCRAVVANLFGTGALCSYENLQPEAELRRRCWHWGAAANPDEASLACLLAGGWFLTGHGTRPVCDLGVGVPCSKVRLSLLTLSLPGNFT